MENLKKEVARAAIEYVKEGMTIGCGTGSTAIEFLMLLRKVSFKDSLVCVPTSNRTRQYLKSKGFVVKEVDEVESIDLGIDGADYVELDTGVCVKGGGGAHVLEKKVAEKCDEFMVIVDSSKIIENFDGVVVPIEVKDDGVEYVVKKMIDLGLDVNIRNQFSDGGGVLVDVTFNPEKSDMNLLEFDEMLKTSEYVVDTGVFLDQMDVCLVSYKRGDVRMYEF